MSQNAQLYSFCFVTESAMNGQLVYKCKDTDISVFLKVTIILQKHIK